MPRGIELYRGRPIAHSLGNFVLQPATERAGARPARLSPSRESFVLRLTLASPGRVELDVIPIVIPADGRPRLAGAEHADRITQKVVTLSAALGTELNDENGRARLSL